MQSVIPRILLLLFCGYFAAEAVTQAQLDIKWNTNFLNANGLLVYGSIVESQIPWSQRSDGEIVHLAMVAFQAMESKHSDYNQERQQGGIGRSNAGTSRPWPKHIPGVMTVLVTGNSAYLASSAKGGSLFYNPSNGYLDANLREQESVFRRTLVDNFHRCSASRVAFGDSHRGHRTGASCGEYMALLAYDQKNSNQRPTQARMVTVSRIGPLEGDKRKVKKLEVDPPCSAHPTLPYGFGCTQVIQLGDWMGGITIINPQTAPQAFDLDDITLVPLNYA